MIAHFGKRSVVVVLMWQNMETLQYGSLNGYDLMVSQADIKKKSHYGEYIYSVLKEILLI